MYTHVNKYPENTPLYIFNYTHFTGRGAIFSILNRIHQGFFSNKVKNHIVKFIEKDQGMMLSRRLVELAFSNRIKALLNELRD